MLKARSNLNGLIFFFPRGIELRVSPILETDMVANKRFNLKIMIKVCNRLQLLIHTIQLIKNTAHCSTLHAQIFAI